MAEIISFKGNNLPPDNIITEKPFEFRRSDWGSGQFIQMLKSQSERLEKERKTRYGKGSGKAAQLPAHFSLSGGLASTIRALFSYREDEEKMREVYYLTGLMDCLINQVNPILRTALIRDVYRRFYELKNKLGVNWFGPLNQVLLPIDSVFFNELEYRKNVSTAATLKDLYWAIERGTQDMFDVLSHEYVFYCPGQRG